MNDITCVIPNWLCARRTLGAVKSFQKVYPEIPIIVVDDGSTPEDKEEFKKMYGDDMYQVDQIYDPDIAKLAIEGVLLLKTPKHESHGKALDYAIPYINTKWMFTMDSDVRLLKGGIIQAMFKDVDDQVFKIGLQKMQNPDYPHIMTVVNLSRVDLIKAYNLSFEPIYELRLEAGHRIEQFLLKKGYTLKYLLESIREYYIHLRWSKEKIDEWNRYF